MEKEKIIVDGCRCCPFTNKRIHHAQGADAYDFFCWLDNSIDCFDDDGLGAKVLRPEECSLNTKEYLIKGR